jgi:ABC-type oligopeptide transport system ATPase subunit
MANSKAVTPYKNVPQNSHYNINFAEMEELPYDTDPNYMTMLSRVELRNPKMSQQQQNKEAQTNAQKWVPTVTSHHVHMTLFCIIL